MHNYSEARSHHCQSDIQSIADQYGDLLFIGPSGSVAFGWDTKDSDLDLIAVSASRRFISMVSGEEGGIPFDLIHVTTEDLGKPAVAAKLWAAGQSGLALVADGNEDILDGLDLNVVSDYFRDAARALKGVSDRKAVQNLLQSQGVGRAEFAPETDGGPRSWAELVEQVQSL